MTINEIINILANKFNINKDIITENSKLFEDLKLDSLDAVEMIIEFEEKYNIELLDEESESIETIKDLHNLLIKKM
jgi:acyl carrier protein